MDELENKDNSFLAPENLLQIVTGIREFIESASNNEKEIELATLKANEKNEDIQFKKLKEQLEFRNNEQNREQRKFYVIIGFFIFLFSGSFLLVGLEKPDAMDLLKNLIFLITGGFGGFGLKTFTEKKK